MHSLGDLNNKQLFLKALEAVKFKIKVPADLLSGESPCLQRLAFLMCRHVAKGRRALVSSSFYKGINPIVETL